MQEFEEEVEQKSKLKTILVILSISIAVTLLIVYWFVPFRTLQFTPSGSNSNFTINGSAEMQFYSNMRYPDKTISYKISDCPLQKQNDMERAFEILENKTILEFVEKENPEISVTCDSQSQMQGGLFIAGEGGPSNITKTELFNVILNGKILLIRDSSCPDPVVAIHELLHALGFDHSSNPNNIMYNISDCDQTIGDDTINLINELYSTESLPDLSFEKIEAIMHSKYLDTNISVKNNGLANSPESKIQIYSEEKLIQEFELQEIQIGEGLSITAKNIYISKLKIEKLEFVINNTFSELDKKNNKEILKIN